MDERWYLCLLHDASQAEEPDWSRVPVERREKVRAIWLQKTAPLVTDRVYLWGPQIAFFESLPYYSVEVLQ